MANNNIGSKRLVVGAHYGLRDWMAQRLTAIIMAIYTVILLVVFLTGNNFSYEGWAGLFSHQWFKIATFVTFVSLFYHAWVGMRDVWMDYVTGSVALRLVFQMATIVWLIGCAGWAAQIIWRA
ncbi:succinate dehydrogenase, hydrophobic membrane anchor protein [Noviherbaspirillum sp. Root189]|jgi:succinate dehydrogenase / fumarate reductase membrane anchor subunit|uniref:succinate dehydrogenase, hydrophobic membrane anchor protein n=1 Tax=Noviherbaspirillum sp. Root189 TaxID=1736487 RepID=UPI00070EC823|nr:succinate dehydrogenase, hydrophobic membrane anchor protein [Noviherbaspirillum sp. Root189]KRB84512.1 succinate dehydrogenase [Noviherbaspirillum sp. Root189]